jgi:hypothetical protein
MSEINKEETTRITLIIPRTSYDGFLKILVHGENWDAHPNLETMTSDDRVTHLVRLDPKNIFDLNRVQLATNWTESFVPKIMYKLTVWSNVNKVSFMIQTIVVNGQPLHRGVRDTTKELMVYLMSFATVIGDFKLFSSMRDKHDYMNWTVFAMHSRMSNEQAWAISRALSECKQSPIKSTPSALKQSAQKPFNPSKLVE